MNRIPYCFVIGLLLVAFSSIALAQEVPPESNKIWSKIFIDQNSTGSDPIPNFEYKPPLQIPRVFNLENTEVTVNPNYRPKPTTNTTQSELSIDIHPLDGNIIFGSANATAWPVAGVYGTGVYWTTNAGTNWTGFDNPPFGGNSGDPAAAIGTDGKFFVGYISDPGGQGVARSTNNGTNWTVHTVSPGPSSSSDLLDKNHLMVDKKVGSPYENRVYVSYTEFVTGSASNNQIVVKNSSDFGQTWSTGVNISSTLNAGSHNQGVNLTTGPNGEAYAAWAVYDNWVAGGYGEDAIAFAKSTNGGTTWTSSRIYGALTPNGSFNFGIRGNLKPSSIRVSSFPSMAVDRTGGPNNGYIYIIWPQKTVAPAGTDPDIVLIRSTNGGTSWSAPVRVNNDPMNNGKDQYYPWCNVDQSTGRLNIVFYDSREVVNDSAGVYMATSIDGGLTFENFKVSDANFRPKAISGLAGGYQGDYIGIASLNNRAYPYWADDRTGNYQAWIAEVVYGPGIIHTPLENTENMVGPYVINANITSPSPLNPSKLKLVWKRGAGAFADTLSLTSLGSDNYTASIPGNNLPAIYSYYIFAEDSALVSSTSPSGAPTIFYSFEAATDIVLPTVTHTPLNNQAKIRWPASFLATATDNIGLDTVQCEYRINSGAYNLFGLNNTSGNVYAGTFPADSVQIGDVIEYRIKATDNSSQSNVGYNPLTGYHSFNIIDTRGLVLVIDDDVVLAERISDDKGGEIDNSIPLGISAGMFTTKLNAVGFTADQVSFAALDTTSLSNYDVVILSAGTKESTTATFSNAGKRAAIVNYTLAGGKTLVEGGEVGYIFRKSGTTTDLDPPFRMEVLNDSSWVSDRASANIAITNPSHSMFTDPNGIPGPITVTNSSGNGWGARDEVTLLTKPGVRRVANWSTTTVGTNGSLIIHHPNNDTTKVRNVFFAFAVSQITPSTTAEALIENAVELLVKDLIIPVELSSFNAAVINGEVSLYWTTATELNNRGFEIQRKAANGEYQNLGFVPGFGTTTERRSYSFVDNKAKVGAYSYRLKQMDYDGTYSFSDEVNVDVNPPLVFSLEQNYPNPFNPSTIIKYSIPQDGFVNLAVYNLLGEKVATLVNDVQKAGRYDVNFDASRLASGIYFYTIESANYKSVKKMMLIK